MKVLASLVVVLIFILFTSLECPAQDFDKIKVKLDSINEVSLSLRSEVRRTIREHGIHSEALQQLNSTIIKFDSLALLEASSVLNKYGWLKESQVGKKTSKSLFLIVQHAEPEVVEKYLPLLQAAVREGEADPRDLALMEDRLHVAKGLPQKYGTQYFYNSEKEQFQLFKTVQWKQLRSNRKEVGLSPIKRYLRENKILPPN